MNGQISIRTDGSSSRRCSTGIAVNDWLPTLPVPVSCHIDIGRRPPARSARSVAR